MPNVLRISHFDNHAGMLKRVNLLINHVGAYSYDKIRRTFEDYQRAFDECTLPSGQPKLDMWEPYSHSHYHEQVELVQQVAAIMPPVMLRVDLFKTLNHSINPICHAMSGTRRLENRL